MGVSRRAPWQLRGNLLLNLPFDVRRIQHPPRPRCPNDFTDQLRMRNCLPRLHDPDNCRLSLKLPILGRSLVRGTVFFFRFFGLNLVNLDAVLRVGEFEVESEGVVVGDVFGAGGFAEDLIFGAGEGLEGALELEIG